MIPYGIGADQQEAELVSVDARYDKVSSTSCVFRVAQPQVKVRIKALSSRIFPTCRY